MLIPVEVEVDNEATPLLVVDRPVDSELTPDCAVLIPVEVDVDSDATALLVVDKPVELVEMAVESEETLLTVVLATE